MKPKLNLIGLAIMVIGGVISATVPAVIYIGAPFVFLGVLLLMGFYSVDVFIDYITLENGEYIYSIRKRNYYHFFPLFIMFELFLKIRIKFVYKVDYYKIASPTFELKNITPEIINNSKISRAEYKQLIDCQKQQYSNKSLPQEIIDVVCSPEVIKVKAAITRYIICLIVTGLMLTMFTQPEPIALPLGTLYSSLFAWLTVLKYGDYKRARFKNEIYNKYKNPQ